MKIYRFLSYDDDITRSESRYYCTTLLATKVKQLEQLLVRVPRSFAIVKDTSVIGSYEP